MCTSLVFIFIRSSCTFHKCSYAIKMAHVAKNSTWPLALPIPWSCIWAWAMTRRAGTPPVVNLPVSTAFAVWSRMRSMHVIYPPMSKARRRIYANVGCPWKRAEAQSDVSLTQKRYLACIFLKVTVWMVTQLTIWQVSSTVNRSCFLFERISYLRELNAIKLFWASSTSIPRKRGATLY